MVGPHRLPLLKIYTQWGEIGSAARVIGSQLEWEFAFNAIENPATRRPLRGPSVFLA